MLMNEYEIQNKELIANFPDSLQNLLSEETLSLLCECANKYPEKLLKQGLFSIIDICLFELIRYLILVF